MQRGLVHVAAWTLATGAAVALSWFGVHTVLSGTAYDAPRALPLTSQVGSSEQQLDGATPRVSSTHRPKPTPSPTRSTAPDDPTPSHPAMPSPTGSTRPRPPSDPPGGATPAADGQVKSYATSGGRVVLDMDSRYAQLVSATPNPGWEMQVWKQVGWLRVDFTSGDGGHTSVICTWNDHPPTVTTSNQAT
ncbi:hypothetical protein [Streptomyces sp. bgisy130]|uniref:hypothetical protein n=1 Tax=Streptomyces sp. bgisy130 TaxID=3413788 RepID=UPI003F4A0EF6